MGNLKILVFIDWFDPAFRAGGPVTSVRNFILRFESRASFFIVTGNREYGNDEVLNVPCDQWTNYGQSSKVYYAGKLTPFLISKLFAQVRPDKVYINGLYSLRYSIWPLIRLKSSGCEIIVAPRGMLSPGSMAVKALKKKLFIRLAGLLKLYKNIIIHATGEKEAGEIRSGLGKSVIIRIAQNLPSRLSDVGTVEKMPSSLSLAMIARIAPEKNTLYAIELLAALDNGCSLDLYGPVYDQTYLRKIESCIKDHKLEGKVRILGYIKPTELSTVIKSHHLLVLPSSGENYGHTIVEALSMGRPVLISDKTPWHNLKEAKAGYDLDLAQQNLWLEAIRHFQSMAQQEFDEWCSGALKYSALNLREEEMEREYASLFGF